MSLSPSDELIVKMCEIKTYIHLLIDMVLTEPSLNKEMLISDECKQNLKEKIF